MKATRRNLVLRLLRAAGDRGVTTGELLGAGVGSRYGARIGELRADGFIITSEREREGEWRYRLLREPGAAPPPVALEPRRAPRRRPVAPGQIALFDAARAA